MQRRARIKAVANLSNVRRGVNKNNPENSQENENSKLNDVQEKSSSNEQEIVQEIVLEKSVESQQSSNLSTKNAIDDVNKKNDFLDKGNDESDINCKAANECSQSSESEVTIEVEVKEQSFKTPVSVTPRADNESSVTTKFRKPKIAPRLNISRGSSIKIQETDEKQSNNKNDDAIIEIAVPAALPVQEDKPPESPVTLFSPPRPPRSETPRDFIESPIIQNTPQSPFHSVPHQRIRTESLCSIKSTTVANLQPRKKVRTEDQKILDNKRESRERLSNKKIEKSQLRMFDMIYYNPTTNPMKPRAAVPSTTTKEPPKKPPIDLTVDVSPPQSKESAAIPVPQLRLNDNGELVLDEASLVVENEEQKKNRILLANTNVVYHDELSGTYGYYKRQQRTKDWPQEETIKFYRCLNTVGTDFSLMLNLFPNRSRRDLKLKFKKEEKNNPHLVDKALLFHNTFDIEHLQRKLDEEDELRKKETESRSSEVKELVKKKILKKQEAKAKARQHDKAKIEKILSDGDLVLNAVDNPEVKENLDKSDDTSTGKRNNKRKAAKRKSNFKPEPHMEFKKIVLHTQVNPSISVEELKSSLAIPKTQPQDKAAVIVRDSDVSAESVPAKIEHSQTIPVINQVAQPENHTMLTTTGKFISDVITDSYAQDNNYLMDVEDDFMAVKKEEPSQRKAIEEILNAREELNEVKEAVTSQPESAQLADTISYPNSVFDVETSAVQVIDGCGSVETNCELITDNSGLNDSSELVTDTCDEGIYSRELDMSITGQIVNTSDSSSPTLGNNGLVSTCDSIRDTCGPVRDTCDSKDSSDVVTDTYEPVTGNYEPATDNYEPATDNYEPATDTYELATDTYEPVTNTYEPVIDTYDSVSRTCDPITDPNDNSEPLDDESFLNSLNLERLVIVVKQIGGKDVYDIHETQGDTEKLSDEPLNLPRHLVDLIVSAMTQDD